MAQTKKSENSIDEQNLQVWYNQYSNPISIYEEANQLLNKAIKKGYEKGVTYAKLNLAKACFLQSKNKEAFEWVTACLPYFYENPSEPGYAWILNLHGNMLESLGDYEKGLELCLKAFKKAKETNDKTTEAEAASMLGLIYSRLCNFNKALDFYQKALSIRESMDDEDAMASSLNRLGMINRQLKNYDESLKFYFQSLAIRERKKLIGAIPWTMLGIASTYEEMNKYAQALEYYQKGAKDFDKRCILQCKLGIGRIYCQQNNHELAEIELTDSLKMAIDLNAKPLIAEVYSALAQNYEWAGHHEKALIAYKNYQKTKESV
jgi:tetratricopeptide (TPR) repeat protein